MDPTVLLKKMAIFEGIIGEKKFSDRIQTAEKIVKDLISQTFHVLPNLMLLDPQVEVALFSIFANFYPQFTTGGIYNKYGNVISKKNVIFGYFGNLPFWCTGSGVSIIPKCQLSGDYRQKV